MICRRRSTRSAFGALTISNLVNGGCFLRSVGILLFFKVDKRSIFHFSRYAFSQRDNFLTSNLSMNEPILFPLFLLRFVFPFLLLDSLFYSCIFPSLLLFSSRFDAASPKKLANKCIGDTWEMIGSFCHEEASL